MAARGKGWESLLELRHDAYWREAQAFIARCHHGSKLVRRGGREEIIFDARGPVDFMGTVRWAPTEGNEAQGVSIAAEAKEVNSKRWQFSLLKPHQAAQLGATDYMGGFGLLLLSFRVEGARNGRLVLWRDVRERYKAGEKGLSMDDSACRTFEGTDWLPNFLKAWRHE
jgi:penicillin-binding protein-related factor A (putative recombinase)